MQDKNLDWDISICQIIVFTAKLQKGPTRNQVSMAGQNQLIICW
jgi:hypothetical protein